MLCQRRMRGLFEEDSIWRLGWLTWVSTMALKPCLVTERKVCPVAAALIASIAIPIDPSYTPHPKTVIERSYRTHPLSATPRPSSPCQQKEEGTYSPILKPNRHTQCGGQLSVHLTLGSPRSDRSPGSQLGGELRGDRVYPNREECAINS